MHAPDLAKSIFAVRNTNAPSRMLLPASAEAEDPAEPIGILLLKPSSGHFPLKTIAEILDRLTVRHGYRIRSAAWWNGSDIKAHGVMALHYPGFHRVAHAGLPALSPAARTQLGAIYGPGSQGDAFRGAFGVPFEQSRVRTPYELAGQGLSPERLNEFWELDRSQGPSPVQRVQRLDDDAFALGLQMPSDNSIPGLLRGQAVVLLNGFFAKLEKDFEARGCVAIWIRRPASSMTSWDDLRGQYAGKTNPFMAAPRTVRGDAARGVLEVETVSILANVIHLSANETEGHRETLGVWWAPTRIEQVFGEGVHASSPTLAQAGL